MVFAICAHLSNLRRSGPAGSKAARLLASLADRRSRSFSDRICLKRLRLPVGSRRMTHSNDAQGYEAQKLLIEEEGGHSPVLTAMMPWLNFLAAPA